MKELFVILHPTRSYHYLALLTTTQVEQLKDIGIPVLGTAKEWMHQQTGLLVGYTEPK